MTKPTTAQWKAELANLAADRPAAAERGTYADHPDQVALFDGRDLSNAELLELELRERQLRGISRKHCPLFDGAEQRTAKLFEV